MLFAPNTSPAPRHDVRRRRALGLVEVLLCSSLGAMLLLAVGFAFNASFMSYKDAQERGQTLNAARGFLTRLTADIRMCDVAYPYDSAAITQFSQGTTPGSPNSGPSGSGGSGISSILLTKSHADSWDPLASSTNPYTIHYWLDTTSQQIFMTRTPNGGTAGPGVVVCGFVQNLQLYLMPFRTSPSASYILKRVSIVLTLANKNAVGARILTDGNQNITLVLTDAATPRKLFPGY